MSNPGRVFGAVFGVFLFCIGLFALAQDHLSFAWRLGGGSVLILFGVNSLYAAFQGKESWLSRLGPLP